MPDKIIESSRTADGAIHKSQENAGGAGGNLVELAQRIKAKRIERRLTIEQLAAATGLTRSWLSKVENFRVTPSLAALFKIAANLGVPLSELVEGLDEGPEICVVRKGEGRVVDRDSSAENAIRYESLAHRRQARAMEPFLLTIPPNTSRSQLLPHDGEEFLLVIDGQATFDYGDDTYLLNRGDCLYFDGSTPHRVGNNTNETAQVLCVFYVS